MNSLIERFEELAAYISSPADLHVHPIMLPDELEPYALVIYLLSVTDSHTIHNKLMIPLLEAVNGRHGPHTDDADQVEMKNLFSLGKTISPQPQDIASALFQGNCVVLFQSLPYALAVEASQWHDRSVTQPERESTLIGPKDSFIEDIYTNVSMIRRRVRHHTLKIEEYTIGSRSDTKVMLVYMEDLVNLEALNQYRERLKQIRFDLVLESSQIGYVAVGQKFSPFPLFQLTERPDKAASALMEGRFLQFTDTTPTCLILPVTMTCLYETADDYYFPSFSGSFLRLIRLLGLAITLFLPALYIAITAVNQDVFRIQFMLAVASSREGVPYPAFIEVIIMLLLIELINEATVRLPKTIGGTATIVGGLIIGTAAAQSHLISYIMIVITATTAIGSYTAPNYMVGLAWRLCSFFLVLLAIPWGLYGIVIGSACIGLYLCNIESFGVPYAAPFNTFRYRDLFRDALTRAPFLLNKLRPSTYSARAAADKRGPAINKGDDW